jgi:glucosamine 6-phosphate synthetase-like amidotransferase/phosphosugar isomerase protein
MCAIVGMIGNVPEGQWSERMTLLDSLLLAAEQYGPHATGFVAQASPLKRPSRRSVLTAKQPLRVRDFIRLDPDWRQLRRRRAPVVLAHTRWKTHGSADDRRNNHPFRSRDGRFHLVHNGVLSNFEEVDDRHQLRRDGECDSETILRLVEQVGDARLGLSAVLGELTGSLSVGLYDHKTGLLWLANNGGRPMHVCSMKGRTGWVFASTGGILRSALRRAYGEGYEQRIEALLPLAPYTLHALSGSGKLLGMEPSWGSEAEIRPVED